MNTTTMTTPAGPLTIVESDGMVRAAGFTSDAAELLADRPSAPAARADLGPISRAVRAYFDGDLTALDEVPVQQHSGGEFVQHAWEVLRQIKPGEPVTYTEFARLAGRPRAVRAA